jgi:Toprim domain/CHC2 zinc finger
MIQPNGNAASNYHDDVMLLHERGFRDAHLWSTAQVHEQAAELREELAEQLAEPVEEPADPPSRPNGAGDTRAKPNGEAPYPSLRDIVGGIGEDGKVECPSPEHADSTPSCHIYDDHFHCYGCGVHGSTIDWLMLVEGLNREQALAHLASWQGQPIRRQRATTSRPAAETLEFARELWDAAEPLAGTLAERYLAEVRCIDVEALPAEVPLRFHPDCVFGAGHYGPCLLALFQDVETDAFAGIHRIAVTRDVFTGGRVQRRTLGRWPRPRAVKLWPAGPRLFAGEGIETVLAAATRLRCHDGSPMRPAWACVSGSGLSGFPAVRGVDELVVLADNDASGVGQASAADCMAHWHNAGRKTRRLMPNQPDTDFNDVVREMLR